MYSFSILYIYNKKGGVFLDKNECPKQKEVYIPRSIIQIGKFKGFPHMNWIEAVFFTILVQLLIIAIPFVPLIKIICCIVIGISMFYVALHGINGRSLLQIFFASIRHYKRRKFYIRRRLSDDIEDFAGEYKIGKKSIIERFSDKFEEIESKIDKYRKY